MEWVFSYAHIQHHLNAVYDYVISDEAVYAVLAVTVDGQKEVIGIYFGDSEASSFWRSVLNDLKARGIATQVQLCLVHQMRNSMKHMTWKDFRGCVCDLKKVYKAANADMALQYLDEAEVQKTPL